MKKKRLFIILILISGISAFAIDKSTTVDTDGDGIMDSCDLDSDNDGIPDIWEDLNHNGLYQDDDVDGDNLVIATLGDAVSSYLDLDSDNDGVPDLMESGVSLSVIDLYDSNHTGKLTGPVGTNGLLDALETFADSGIPVYTLRNTDGDDKFDFIDLNSDGMNYDLYVSGNENYDLLGSGFITPISDPDKDGIMEVVDNVPLAMGTTDASTLPTTIDYAMVSEGINAGSGASAVCSVMPVKLKYLKAKMVDGLLVVSWATTSEVDNDHFDIEVSSDGKNFSRLKTVKPKTENGSSVAVLEYEETINLNEIILSGLPLLLLGMLSFTRSKRRLFAAFFFGIIFFTLYSCSREQDDVRISPGRPVYVRLLQVDKDGTKAYSRITTVLGR